MSITDSHRAPPQEPLVTALEWLGEGIEPVLVAVVHHQGSVPGTTGARMVVTASAIAGTVGGGSVEHEMIELARSAAPTPRLVTWVHAAPENDSLCSGRQHLALLSLGQADRPALEAILQTTEAGGCGTLELRDTGLRFVSGPASPATFEAGENRWCATQPVGLLDTLTIIGGGHVALALSRVVSTLPFRIVVLDGRAELATLSANHHAHERRIVDYAEVVRHVTEGVHSWVVIMTHGHRHDQAVLERLVACDLRYLGMMGSRSKVRAVLANLEAQGVSPELLARVRAPIGIPIGSHSPAEIAISIAAELIAVRNAPDPRSPAR